MKNLPLPSSLQRILASLTPHTNITSSILSQPHLSLGSLALRCAAVTYRFRTFLAYPLESLSPCSVTFALIPLDIPPSLHRIHTSIFLFGSASIQLFLFICLSALALHDRCHFHQVTRTASVQL